MTPDSCLNRPNANQRLIEKIFVVAVGGRLAVYRSAVAGVDAAPARKLSAPFVRHFRENMQAGPRILRALGVLCGGGQERVRPMLAAAEIGGMELRRRRPESLWIAPDLVQRQEHVVTVERCVLHTLRLHRAGVLLKLHGTFQILA